MATGRPLSACTHTSTRGGRSEPCSRTCRRRSVPLRRHSAVTATAGKPASGYAVDDFAGDLAAFLDVVGIERAVLVASSSAVFTVVSVRRARSGACPRARAPRCSVELARRAGGLGVSSPRSRSSPIRWARSTCGASSRARPAKPCPPTSSRSKSARASRCLPTSGGRPSRGWSRHPLLAPASSRRPHSSSGATRTSSYPARIKSGYRDALPGSRLLVYEGVGHLVQWEQPERVAADIAAFVATLEP